MAAYPVLKYVQNALDSIKGIQVDRINDTEESILIASYLETCYNNLLNRDIEGWPWLRRPVQLVGAADPASPTKVLVPSDVVRLLWLRYDVSDDTSGQWRDVCWQEPEDFICQAGGENSQLVQDSTMKFYVRTDVQPTRYTSLDNVYLHLNGVDTSIESTIQVAKMQAYGIVRPVVELTDEFILDLPEHMISLLQSLLNQMCHLKLRESSSPLDDATVNTQLADLEFTKDRFHFTEFKGRKYGRRR